MKFRLSPEEYAYWGTFIFSAIIVGYLLVTLIDTATRENTAFTQTNYLKRLPHNAVFDTTFGPIYVELFRSQAPVAVSNFTTLARAGFYDRTKFHRIVKDILIQGGDPLSREEDTALYGSGGPGYVFEDEFNGKKMVRGVVAMANLGRPKTNGSQFFILVADQPLMDGKYTVFGNVVGGMGVVDRINASAIDERHVPKDPIYLESVVVE
jgi:cyclophilin family peptidyl-prolyl cis-trans isomerase